MATLQRSSDFELKSDNLDVLGDASESSVSAMTVHVVNTSSLVVSITVKGRSRVKAAADNSVPFVEIPYHKLYLNGAAADGSLVVGTTAITGTSIICVPASGMQIALETDYTSGTGHVYFSPVTTG